MKQGRLKKIKHFSSKQNTKAEYITKTIITVDHVKRKTELSLLKTV